jgi:hypothetical protein
LPIHVRHESKTGPESKDKKIFDSSHLPKARAPHGFLYREGSTDRPACCRAMRANVRFHQKLPSRPTFSGALFDDRHSCVCRKPRALDLMRESLNVGDDGARHIAPRAPVECGTALHDPRILLASLWSRIFDIRILTSETWFEVRRNRFEIHGRPTRVSSVGMPCARQTSRRRNQKGSAGLVPLWPKVLAMSSGAARPTVIAGGGFGFWICGLRRIHQRSPLRHAFGRERITRASPRSITMRDRFWSRCLRSEQIVR